MQASSLLGSTIAEKYQLLSIAGSGGMGAVFKAKDLETDGLVAVKVLHPLQVSDVESRKRFEREAKSISSLSNAHIAQFITHGVLPNAIPYMVLEWLDGISLSSLIQSEKTIAGARAIKIACQIADGLSAAHLNGIIHRDLKPANVLLLTAPEPDFVKIVDFGLSRIDCNSENVDQSLTEKGFLLGTPAYLSPEQCQGARADARSDIYALGCVLYEMLCGEPPFVADNPVGVIHKHANEEVVPLSRKIKVTLPEGLESVVLKCLEKSPDNRYQSMEALQIDLRQVNEKSMPPPVVHLSAEDRALRRKVIMARLLAGLAVLLIIVICVLAQWLASESGNVTRAELSLKNDHSKGNIFQCLDTAERLSHLGGKDAAGTIEKAVDHALKIDSMDPAQALKVNLDLARELLKRGDNDIAFNYAFKTLKNSDILSVKSSQEASREAFMQLLGDIDDAADIMLRSKKVMTKEQLKIALAILKKQTVIIQSQSKGKLVDICLDAISRKNVPLSEDVVQCMFVKDVLLARLASLEELDKSLKKSTEAVGRFQGETTVRTFNEPCLLDHLLDIAAIVCNRDATAAQKYAQQADDLLKKIDKTGQTPEMLAAYYNKMSLTCTRLHQPEKALSYARLAVLCRELQDLGSAKCVNTLVKALTDCGEFAEAEPLATAAYAFYKQQDLSEPEVQVLKGECARRLFQILMHQNRTAAALSLANAELKEEEKHLPDTVMEAADLGECLFDYYFDHAQPRLAAGYAGRVRDLEKHVPNVNSGISVDTRLIRFAVQLNDAKHVAGPVGSLLNRLQTLKSGEIRQDWLNELSSALILLKKADDAKVYAQALEVVQVGFARQLQASDADPACLARVVNDLGSSGEEKIADVLRSQAAEKLPPPKASVFLARSMDFVVGDSSEGSRYADPQHAVKVYLDLSHSMQSKKDNQSAAKYAFEALKIVQVLSVRKPEMKAGLLDCTDEAAAVMLQCKQPVTEEQWKIIREMAGLQIDNIRKEGKDHILDLVLQSQPRSVENLPPEFAGCLLVKDDILARHGETAALDIQVNKTIRALSKMPGMSLTVVDHLVNLTDSLSQHHDSAAAHRYLNMAKKSLEELPADHAGIESAKLAQSWSKLSAFYNRLGDRQSALVCARKSAGLRPLQDAVAVEYQLLLSDRLMDSGLALEAEPAALAAYKFIRSRAQTPDMMRLRLEAAKRLFQIENALHKEAQAAAFVQEELDSCKKPASGAALTMICLNKDLTAYYVAHDNNKAAALCLNQVRQLKAVLPPAQKLEAGRSGVYGDLFALSVRVGDSRLASELSGDLTACKNMDKADSLKQPSRWWSVALLNFKKSGETQAYKNVLDYVQEGFRQILAGASPDAPVLADVVNSLAAAGEDTLAGKLQSEALKKLPEAARAAFTAKCQDKPSEDNKENPGEGSPEAGQAKNKDNSGAVGKDKSEDAGAKTDESRRQ